MSDQAKSRSERTPAGASRAAANRLQPKLEVSRAGDPFEREADAVAESVAAGRPAPAISRLPASGAPPRDEETVRRAAAEEKRKEPAVQRKAEPEKKEPGKVQRAAEPEKKEPKVQREAAGPEREEPSGTAQREASWNSGEAMSAAAEHAVANKGGGRPLDAGTRARIESSTGADLSGVRVHDDSAAHSASRALNARAFTHGSDVWLGAGESSRDLRLMAHEATHVVQQTGAAQRLVQRDGSASPAPDPARAEEDLHTFRLPRIKERHLPAYEAWAARGALKRVKGYDRGEPDQKDSVWLPNVMLPADKLEALDLPPSFRGRKRITIHGRRISGTYSELVERLKVPTWDRSGTFDDFPFEVDHIVELQVGSWAGGSEGAANDLQNMELLDKRSNASAGSNTRRTVRENVRRYLETTSGERASGGEVSNWLRDNDLSFNRVVLDEEAAARRSQHWTRSEIEAGTHLSEAQPQSNEGEAGSSTSFALMSPGGTVLGQFAHEEGQTPIPVGGDAPESRCVAGLHISSINPGANYTSAERDDEIGHVRATLELPEDLRAPAMMLRIPLHSAGQYAGYLGELPRLGRGDLRQLSPVEFDQPTFDEQGLVLVGHLRPSLPLLGSSTIDVQIRGTGLAFVYYYSPGELSLPIPGVSIDDSLLGVSFGTDGFHAEGSILFSVERMGRGTLTAGVDGSGNFEAAGSFDFDSQLFDQAQIELWYREQRFGGRGTVRIDTPDKVRGIRRAEATANFSEGEFSASGTVEPDIPGVESATLIIAHSEDEGLVIRGTAILGREVPGISSGSLEAEVRRPPGEAAYRLSAHGTAVPAIPGINTSLDVAYDDGALTISGHADYSRGMLSGAVDLGVTNRELDPSGQPTDSIGGELRAYGGGALTVRIAPWLQGTVGVRFLPNGELELAGEIGLPSQLEIFSRRQIDKSLLNIAVQVPIFPGIVAEIGGGLSAQAGIGPGMIDQLRLGIVYNPAHEENTHVTGDAHLNIPADAGLRLAVRAGIGLGITGASATGGLEIGGMLGIGGAAEAGVHIDWMPATGLRIDAFGELHAEPKFRFDISGYVSVRALGFSVYDNRWEFASYEFGSNLRFGVRFPIHYVEGQPFDISLDDVEFTVPEVNPRELLRGLVERIA
jgi:hypothetical protein